MVSFLLLLLSPFALGRLILPDTNLNPSNETTSLLLPGDAYCLGAVYGVDLNPDSCINAWEKMPRTLIPITYGSRNQHLSISFPIRYQSDDGLCVIDLRAKHGDAAARGDVARSIDICDAARLVIDKCMRNPRRTASGGSTWGFSMNTV